MDLIVRTRPPAPARAWQALRSRGVEYAWHKLLRPRFCDRIDLETTMVIRRPSQVLDSAGR